MIDAKIYTLLKAAESGNYTKASRELNLTQPAVSQQIKALENELGIRIFDRIGNRLILTREGELTVECCRGMLSQYNNLKEKLKNDVNGILSLKIGITHSVESSAAAEALAKYANIRHGIRMKLITAEKTVLQNKLMNFELDFAIAEGKPTDPSLSSMLLDTDRLLLVIWPDHPLSHKESVTIEDIRGEKLILRLPNSGTSNMFISSLESRNISIDEFNVILEADNIATIKDMIRGGYGVSVLAKSACSAEIKKKKLIGLPVDTLDMKRETHFIYRSDFNHTDLLDELKQIYQEF